MKKILIIFEKTIDCCNQVIRCVCKVVRVVMLIESIVIDQIELMWINIDRMSFLF